MVDTDLLGRYEVTINGVRTVLKMTAEHAKQYPDAKAITLPALVPQPPAKAKRTTKKTN